MAAATAVAQSPEDGAEGRAQSVWGYSDRFPESPNASSPSFVGAASRWLAKRADEP